ncbi:MAG: hypothetical protein AAF456_08390 [Planctomycetota bacterium]
MNRINRIFCAACLFVFAGQSALVGQTESSEEMKWQEDPVCQSVFHGVLEGLYRDRVDIAIVDSIIGPYDANADEEKLKQRLMRSFVDGCPLCEPTFHAFLAYQSHLHISGGFQFEHEVAAMEDGLRTSLLDDDPQSRLMALHQLVTPWLQTRFASAQHSEEEMLAWRARIQQRVDEGKQMLFAFLNANDPNYGSWSVYWGCAACNAARDSSASISGAAPESHSHDR